MGIGTQNDQISSTIERMTLFLLGGRYETSSREMK